MRTDWLAQEIRLAEIRKADPKYLARLYAELVRRNG